MYTFQTLGVLELVVVAGKSHATYAIVVKDEEAIAAIWSTLSFEKVRKLPTLSKPSDWVGTRHPSGVMIVKTGSSEVLKSLSPSNQPMVFESLNRSQRIGWNVNSELLTVAAWALKNRTDAFADIWEQVNPEARATKVREAKAITDMGKRLLNKTFYHVYYYDFRGRKYPSSAYLHEQGSDLSKGLLLRAERKPIGARGYWWLMVTIASEWAGDADRSDGLKTDKIPLQNRFEWAERHEDLLLSYAEAPKINTGWMSAENPWRFLAGCIELKNLRVWQFNNNDFNSYGYQSGYLGFIDGSNNGCQHLAALTRDEVTAVHVNLVKQEYPGDLYRYVASSVWESVNAEVSRLPADVVARADAFIDDLMTLKREISAKEFSDETRAPLVNALLALKNSNPDIDVITPQVFWRRVDSAKERRKIVKRNVMTLPYGGTPYGLGEQQISDAKKHGIALLLHMQHRWAAFMGRRVYEDCKVSLKRPMQLLSLFEDAGRKAEEEGRFLSWVVPITKFPVVQNYTSGKIKKIYVQYGPPVGARKSTGYYENTLQINICFIEDVEPTKGKQIQGASPNAIHSLDAAHVAITVCNTDADITTIHDSFGALLSDMDELFVSVRKSFVQLYNVNPLKQLFDDIGADMSNVSFGNLDVSAILESEYAFSP